MNPVNLMVKKRQGNIVQFDAMKIKSAVQKCLDACGEKVDNFPVVCDKIIETVSKFSEIASLLENADNTIHVEDIQDIVENVLMGSNLPQASKAYILYRKKREELRNTRLPGMSRDIVADFIHIAKYSQYKQDLYRREVYNESIDRVEGMHVRKYPQIADSIVRAFKKVRERKALPSMRSMQFGGKGVEKINERIYNCSFSPCNRISFFKEAFFLLLCGCGTGFSVQKHHVAQLPPLKNINKDKVVHHLVEDTIEGWGDALNALIMSYVEGDQYVEFSYSKIRPKGSILRSSGGRAPGHLPLKLAIKRIRKLLDNAQGRHLRPIECHDMVCLASEAVLAGGIRRSASLSLFSIDDEEMINAKTGEWWKTHPWRQRANNSAALLRSEATFEQYDRLFRSTKEYGEPGFLFVDNLDYGTNPCSEVQFNPFYTVDFKAQVYLRERGINANIGDILCGWSFCNLTEINVARCLTEEEFLEAVEAATIIGTCQAGYLDFPYLGPVTELLAQRDALLGVSMTGMVDNPVIAFNADLQRRAALYCKEVNEKYAALLGINSAARLTAIKPSGTASLALGCVGSGIHPHHAKRYFRRVRMSPGEAVYQYFKSINPHMCEKVNDTEDVITFCIEAPENAVTRNDMTALQFLEKVFLTQTNWIAYGTARDDGNPGLKNNVSNTVVVKPDEWEDVKHYLWDRRFQFSGISMLGYSGDKDYAFAPREEITTEKDEFLWNNLVSNYKPVDYQFMLEMEDGTSFQGEAACSAGGCE